MVNSFQLIQLKAQVERLRVSKSYVDKELAPIKAGCIRDDIKAFRLKKQQNELDKKIRSLETHLIPDIIA